MITVTPPTRMNRLQPASSLLKMQDSGKTHVTLIQEMNSNWPELKSTVVNFVVFENMSLSKKINIAFDIKLCLCQLYTISCLNTLTFKASTRHLNVNEPCWTLCTQGEIFLNRLFPVLLSAARKMCYRKQSSQLSHPVGKVTEGQTEWL